MRRRQLLLRQYRFQLTRIPDGVHAQTVQARGSTRAAPRGDEFLARVT